MFKWLRKASVQSNTADGEHNNKQKAPKQDINVATMNASQLMACVNDTTLATSTRCEAVHRVASIDDVLAIAQAHHSLTAACSMRIHDLDSTWFEQGNVPESFVVQLLSKHDVSADIKASVVSVIEDRTHANRLLKQLSDKQGQRLLRNKIKVLADAEKANQSTVTAATELVDKLSHLAKLPWNSQLAGKVRALKTHWDELALDRVPNDVLASYEQHMASCDARLEAHREEQDRLDAQQAHDDALRQCVDVLEAHTATLSSSTPNSAEPSSELLQTTSQRWTQLNDAQNAERALASAWEQASAKLTAYIAADTACRELKLDDLRNAFDSMSVDAGGTNGKATLWTYLDALKGTLDEALRTSVWPDWLAPSAQHQEVTRLRNQVAELHKTHHKQHEKSLDHVRHKNRELGRKLSEKNLLASSRLMFYIDQKVDALPDKLKVQAHGLLEKNKAELATLQSLNDFATAPKKEALCEQVEALLLVSNDSPEDRADQIKNIQAEWKQSNPVVVDDDPLWERFNAAVTKAWEPCAAFYADNQKVREANVQKRIEVCDQVEQLLNDSDWGAVDWKSILQVSKVARQEWRQAEPVDFKLNKPVQKRFYGLLDQVEDKIRAQQTVLLADKQALIDRAIGLEEVGLDKAITTCKHLQQQWKSIGVLIPGEDRALWKTFRAACDAVFKRLDDKRQESRAAVDALVTEADSVIDQIKTLVSQDDAALLSSRDQLQTLKAQFDAIEGMPEKLQERKAKALSAAMSGYESQHDAAMSRRNRAVFDQINVLATKLDDYESSPSDEVRDAISALLDELRGSRLNSVLKQVFKRFETGEASADAQSRLEQLAIEYEILADMETPASHKEQRVAYQLACLTDPSQKTSALKGLPLLVSLDVRWAEIGGVHGAAKAALEARRRAAREAIAS
ncbi:MAG: DUF349 domain-containing protein [Pseudomonadota bacterium]